MNIIKYNEKLLIWMHRENKTILWLASELNQTRQTISAKLKDNSFNQFDKEIINTLGFKE